MEINEKLLKKWLPVLLYSGTTTTTATLSQNINLFKRIKIFVINGDNHRDSIEIYNNNNSTVYTTRISGSTTNTFYGKNARIGIDGTNLTIDRKYNVNVPNGAYPSTSVNNTVLRVERVEGYYY